MRLDDIDPSLRAGEPLLESLEDGFSPPPSAEGPPVAEAEPAASPEPALGSKSPF
ncbi:hypothetical protein GCM10028796_29230 [Ramlibacter monticola]|uniref:Uncharacterized protein n=1 Tax=Ramlibacter monticola TaxID=1926872 RepID=A0A936YYZ0_9BURK|nr:hypothetical protein [Ramlibacter monticola]MBL0390716.1 hypothetical protein [Ramlibacter monticola]